MSAIEQELPRVRHPPASTAATGSQGIVHVDRPRAGPHPAGHDHRLRRQPHQHARRVRRDRLRHRHQPGARRARHADAWRWRSPRCAASRSTATSAAGVYAKDVILHIIRTLGRQGRRRLRLRVRRRRLRPHVDGRAHDRLQHEHRGRCALRLRQPRRDDLRLPARPPLRAAGRRRSTRAVRLVERHGVGRRTPPTTTSSCSTAATSRRWSPGASTPVRRSASTRRIPDASSVRRPTSAPPSRRRYAYMDWKPGSADRRHEDRRRLHRLVHQRPHLRPARSGARRRQGQGEAARARRSSCRARRMSRAPPRRRGCTRSSAPPVSSGALPGCSMCLAMNPDKLDRPAGLRLVEQPQLQGPAGQPDRAARC